MSIDIGAFAASLLPRAADLLSEWFPNGKLRGHEFVVGSLSGDDGESLSVNTQTGLWSDFATGEKGKDLVALYAAMHNLKQPEAAKALGATNGANGAAPVRRRPQTIDAPQERPPADAPPPGNHPKHGAPAALYAYRDASGLIGYVARYETPAGKTFSPYIWVGGKWQAKAFAKPRPLYRLDVLQAAPADQRVLLVEGEKCAEAAQPLFTGSHVVMAWPGGAQAIAHVDFEPLRGRRVDLWPDNDHPGRECMAKLAATLLKLDCAVRVVRPDGQPEGWDVADAVAAGWGRTELKTWLAREDGKFVEAVTLPPVPVTPRPKEDAPLHERQLWAEMDLDCRTHNGKPVCNEDAVTRILNYLAQQHGGKPLFWYDEFLQRACTSWNGPARALSDGELALLAVWLQREGRLAKMRPGIVTAGVEAYCYVHKRNTAREWLESLEWDRRDRLVDLFPLGFGAARNQYHQQAGRNFMMQMAHRLLEPGCQADYMPVFEGEEGLKKSTALRAIGGEWFVESHESMLGKDFMQIMPGKLLIEISELESMKGVNHERVIGIISNRVDRYRQSYGRMAGDYPRMCVFAGTTNRDDWIRDERGARRFWRILTGRIDCKWIEKHREQLFAEAAARVKAGEQHYIIPAEEARELVRNAMTEDAWTERVMTYAARAGTARIDDILAALDIPVERQNRECMDRVTAILRRHNWRKVHGWNGKIATRLWEPRPVTGPESVSTPSALMEDDPDSL